VTLAEFRVTVVEFFGTATGDTARAGHNLLGSDDEIICCDHLSLVGESFTLSSRERVLPKDYSDLL